MNQLDDRVRGPHARGEETRLRILDCAIEAFAARGFEGVSTRELAQEAGVNLPAIQYYFGSKEGLFRASVGHIAAQIEQGMLPAATQVTEALAPRKQGGEPGHAELVALLHTLMAAFVETTLHGDRQAQRRLFFLRAEIEQSPALELLNKSIGHCTFLPLRALIARLLGLPETDETVTLRSLMMLGQVAVFCKPGACSVLGWNTIEPHHLRQVQEMIGAQIDAAFPPVKEEKGSR